MKKTLVILLFIYLVTSSWSNAQESCNTGKQCVNINSCPAMINLLRSKNRTTEDTEFLLNSQCGMDGRRPKVCCVDPIIVTNNNLTELIDSSPLLPKKCGFDLGYRIIRGHEIEIFEYRWMALLEYLTPNGIQSLCSGVLINNRYVLTAAHCLRGKNLTGVRLGEYDTSTSKDCQQSDSAGLDCSADSYTVGIEEQIVHENYNPNDRNQNHNVALVRLSRSIEMTDWVNPICLPRATSDVGKWLTIVGWAMNERKQQGSNKLTQGEVSPVELTECIETYETMGVNLTSSAVCVGPLRDQNTCRSDPGGPLMSLDRQTQKWSAVGVFSLGPVPCDKVGYPGVYTKVSDYVPWILSKLRV